ncbi:MAG: hypothetical protein JWQ40_3855 [Segetibacter sp.]|nr:hypothetical protein [Segetibacter sp.]
MVLISFIHCNCKVCYFAFLKVLKASKGEKTLYSLFDSGATYSCIPEESIEDLEEQIKLHTPYV